MKKIFTTVLIALQAVATWAYDGDENGIYYLFNKTVNTAAVTYRSNNYNSYSNSVVIPETVTWNSVTYTVSSIGVNAFSNSTKLTRVTIPASVTAIDRNAFQGCTSLTSITIPNSVTSIANYAFASCSSFTSVSIPNSVTSIGECVFGDCSGLASMEVESGNTKFDSREGCNAIIETSSNTLIAGCKNTVIPSGVESIAKSAFYSCSGLTSVIIPNNVTSIGENAFSACSNLVSVYNYANTPQNITNSTTFSNASNCTLYVPKGCAEAYRSSNYWNDFKEILEIEDPAEKCATPTISLVNGKVVATSATEGATCTINYNVNDAGATYILEVTAYATAEGHKKSDDATASYFMSIGKYADVNGDGYVNSADINAVLKVMTGEN